jgi:hypothetical protein
MCGIFAIVFDGDVIHSAYIRRGVFMLDQTASLTAKAARFRRLAYEILPGAFRTNLLELARDYETEAARVEPTADRISGREPARLSQQHAPDRRKMLATTPNRLYLLS